MTDTMSTSEVSLATHATLRQLDTWCTAGYVPGQPTKIGSGHRRRWTADDVDEVHRLMKVAWCVAPLTGQGSGGLGETMRRIEDTYGLLP